MDKHEPLEPLDERRPAILVVDDEAPVRRFLKIILERLNYDVETATGGAEAISMARQKSYDVVLTDLVMPRVDGLRVIREVKESSPETEVVVITGYPSSDTIVAATRAGALDYLPKSPDPEHLSVLVEKALEVRALRRKARERDYYLRMAQMDGLTELFNRDTFYRFLEREFARAIRMDKPLSLLFADVDHFATYNRERGHLFGNQVLKDVAGAVEQSCRKYDIVARYGGDKFAVLAPETASPGSQILGHRIGSAVQSMSVRESAPTGSLSLSVGAATFPQDVESAEQLVERADEALGRAKEEGNTVHLAGN
jgi:diguanylate cyclase (GGDEF)-like protein